MDVASGLQGQRISWQWIWSRIDARRTDCLRDVRGKWCVILVSFNRLQHRSRAGWCASDLFYGQSMIEYGAHRAPSIFRSKQL
jgi:hypothetical protein